MQHFKYQLIRVNIAIEQELSNLVWQTLTLYAECLNQNSKEGSVPKKQKATTARQQSKLKPQIFLARPKLASIKIAFNLRL